MKLLRIQLLVVGNNRNGNSYNFDCDNVFWQKGNSYFKLHRCTLYSRRTKSMLTHMEKYPYEKRNSHAILSAKIAFTYAVFHIFIFSNDLQI